MTIREVAELAGWTYDRMKAHLLRLDAKSGGTLLRKSAALNRRYTLLLPALRRMDADMFEPIENLEARVEALEEAQKCHETRAKLIAQQVSEITREVMASKYRRGMSRDVAPSIASLRKG